MPPDRFSLIRKRIGDWSPFRSRGKGCSTARRSELSGSSQELGIFVQ